MDALNGYASSGDEAEIEQQVSRSEPVAGPSTTRSKAKRAAADEEEEEEEEEDEDVQVDANDAFGLNSLNREEESADSTDKERRGKGNKKANGGTKRSAPESDANSLALTAPDVGLEDPMRANALLTRPTDTQMNVNIPYSDMIRPEVGPSNPFSTKKLSQQNTLGGHVEETIMSDFDFRVQQRTFDNHGYARNPSTFASVTGQAYVGDARAAQANQGATALELRGGGSEGRATARELKKRRKGQKGDTSVVDGEGAYVGPWGGWDGEKIHTPVGPTEEEIERAEKLSTTRKKEEAEMQERRQKEEQAGTEKSVFHGKSMYDYQGRTYMHIPTDVDSNLHGEAGSQGSFLPKACIHTWTGHTKGVSALRLFPGSGHLMLSGSMDTKIKLWDVYHEGQCLRTFQGHSKAVRDVTFSNDGRRFLSAGYDRQMKLWDTETGQCIKAFSNGKVPYVVKFHPDEDKQNIFLAGMSDKKIIQFDSNTGEVTQEYDQHLGPVNTITFVDDNRRFVTTSDDKTMRAWDFDIPVVIKYIADPAMHSMPAVSTHPNKKWLACQSLDNQIVVYAADSFRQNRKKIFKGHSVAGYACQVNFSPDGKFISSGDGDGNLVFWDWKSGRLLKRIRAHKEVVITHEWLPHETSKVVTGSWDGLIKLWD